jgi:cell division transport system permease protein
VRAARYSLREALISLRRAGRSTVMSIGTVAVAFLTLGGFLLVATNLQRAVEQWGSIAEMSVFLREDVDEASRTELATDIGAHPAVARVEYLSKEQALARFKADFPELGGITENGESNPFPASLELQLRTDPAAAEAADALAVELRDRDGVTDVRYDRQWIERLMTLAQGIRLTGLAVASVLVLGAAFTVAAVVRLSLFARRDEIEIMRLVGAPFAFIRGPSVAEGTLIGGLGALVALLALFVLYQTFKLRLDEPLAALTAGGALHFLGGPDAALMVLAAVLLGGLTGTAVSRAIR